MRTDGRTIRQIDIGKGDGAAGMIGRRGIAGHADQFDKAIAGRGDGRDVVGTLNGHRQRQRDDDDAAMAVVDGGVIGQDQRFAGGDEVEIGVGDVIRPRHRAVVGVARRRCQGQHRGERVLLRRRQRQRRAIGRGVDVIREWRGYRRPVGQVDISERNDALGMTDRRIAGSDQFDNGRTRRSRRRQVVGSGNRDRERSEHDRVVFAVIGIDPRHVDQGQRLACGEEVEGPVPDAVGPGAVANIGVAGVLDHLERYLHRFYGRQLLQRQRRRDDDVLLRVAVDV